MSETAEPEVDEVLVKREQIRTQVKRYKRIGYLLMLISIVCVFLCWPLHWPKVLVVTAMITFTASCIILPLPIIFGTVLKLQNAKIKRWVYNKVISGNSIPTS